MTRRTTPDLTALLTDIARRHLGVTTLETRRSDGLDFSTQAVWTLKSALEEAWAAGRNYGYVEGTTPPPTAYEGKTGPGRHFRGRPGRRRKGA